MIISASYRTDIPALHADWFAARLAAGWADVRNPYGGRPCRVSLDPADVAAYVFWTRHPAPFAACLDRIAGQNVPFVIQLTVTNYPRPLERAVAPPGRVIAAAAALAARHGPGRLVWRYDPILASDLTPPAWHRDNFARLADALAPITDTVVLSWTQIYAKTRRNLDRVPGLAWRDPDPGAKRALLADLAALAAQRGLAAHLCGQPDLLVPGLAEARCIDPDRLARIAGRPVAAPRRGHRPACGCAGSRDIGAYDTCTQGCAYCYAVGSHDRARRLRAAASATAPFLGGSG